MKCDVQHRPKNDVIYLQTYLWLSVCFATNYIMCRSCETGREKKEKEEKLKCSFLA